MALSPRRARRITATVVLLVAAYYAVSGGAYSAWDLRRLRLDIAARRAELRATAARVDSLRARVRVLERDDSAIERLARELYGMTRPDEVLYRFVRTDSAIAAAGAQP